LIGDEVMRIDRLTEQLLDLASPRAYTAAAIKLHRVIQSGFDLVASKAAGKGSICGWIYGRHRRSLGLIRRP